VLVVVAVVVVALYVSSKGQSQFASVTVSGSAVTLTSGNSPLNVIFTNGAGKVYSATVTSNQYSIVLPTNQTYLVELRYAGAQSIARGSVGDCAVGSITIPSNSGSATVSKNWSC
jgi:hypothetical protein